MESRGYYEFMERNELLGKSLFNAQNFSQIGWQYSEVKEEPGEMFDFPIEIKREPIEWPDKHMNYQIPNFSMQGEVAEMEYDPLRNNFRVHFLENIIEGRENNCDNAKLSKNSEYSWGYLYSQGYKEMGIRSSDSGMMQNVVDTPIHKEERNILHLKCLQCNFRTEAKELLREHVLLAHSHSTQESVGCRDATSVSSPVERVNMGCCQNEVENNTFICHQCNFVGNTNTELMTHVLSHNSHSCIMNEENPVNESPVNTSEPCVTNKDNNAASEEASDKGAHKQEFDYNKGLESTNLCRDGSFYNSSDDFKHKGNRRRSFDINPLSYNEHKIHKCTECDYESKYKANLKLHCMSHSEKKLFQCPECSFATNHKGNFKKHSLSHKEKDFKCSECSFATKYKESLSRHFLIHKKYSTLFEYCDETKEGHLKKTDNEACEGAPFKCSDCSFETFHKDSLRRHLNLHNNYNRYSCSECGYRANTKGNLNLHQLSHNNFKMYKCSQCHYETNHKGNLKMHSVVHTDAKTFRCSSCRFETKYKRSLKVHVMSHSETSFRCTLCPYETHAKSDFNGHILWHKENLQTNESNVIQPTQNNLEEKVDDS